jgi:hypothetical protein
MLAVQKYLHSGKTFADLRAELGIRAVHHDALPLVILNYDQIDSPKADPVVRECRALVLHAHSYELVARGFPRFFNWGELAEEMKRFDLADFTAHTKEDGSLVLLFHFAGAWQASTRASFARDTFRDSTLTWQDGIARALRLGSLAELQGRLDERLCYVCELCSPWNTVVRRYPEPVLYLLSAFRGAEELEPDAVDDLAGALFRRPTRYAFRGIEEVREFLQRQTAADPTFEGVVLRDRHGQRWKMKSPTYLGLHQLTMEGTCGPRQLLPFVLAGEEGELLTYYPEVAEAYRACQEKVAAALARLEEVWEASRGIASQKEFAQAIAGKTPFTGLLFALRKAHGVNGTREQLRQAWRGSGELILRVLFKL